MSGEMDWTEVSRLRQGLYRYFGSAFLPPDDERLEGLVAGADLLDELGIDDFAFAIPWHALTAVVRGCPTTAALEVEHHRLFNSAHGVALCPPHESHYLGRPGSSDAAVIFGDLERRYKSMGAVLRPGGVGLPDHVSTELEVLSMLCETEHLAWQDGAPAVALDRQEDQRRFLTEHPGRWFPYFAHRVVETSDEPFYARLVLACAAFLHHDEQLLGCLSRPRLRVEAT